MDDYLAISALQHYSYCPRQFALIHVEQAWAENRFTAEGRILHLEIESAEPPRYFPVEYKRGKPKLDDWDRIQLCAQALCIEEMKNTSVSEGAVWYWQVRRREVVALDDSLRQATFAAIENASNLLARGSTPPPINKKQRCRACSLNDLCQPDTFRDDWSAHYVAQMGA